MFYTYPNGIAPEVLPCEGPQKTKHDIPLGAKYSPDGVSRFRWAYVTDSQYFPGHVAGQLGNSHAFVLTTSMLQSVAGSGKHGHNVKDTVITLYGASGLTAAKAKSFEEGKLFILSGVGKGHSYRVKWVAIGSSGNTEVWLYDPLITKLSSNSYGVLRPNEFYGLQYLSTKASVGKISSTSVIPRGAFICSDDQNGFGNTSGYMWVQDKGPGVGKCNYVATHGQLLGPAKLSGALSSFNISGVVLTISTAICPWARALSANAAAGQFIACEWLIGKD